MSPLEHRYRRLLAWYPNDHRAVHEDEMVGVLLSMADDGRNRPDWRDTMDLLRGALRAHIHRMRRPAPPESWVDARAMVAAVGSGLLMLWLFGFAVTGLVIISATPASVYLSGERAALTGLFVFTTLCVMALGAAIIANLRRTCVVVLWLLTVVLAWATLSGMPITPDSMLRGPSGVRVSDVLIDPWVLLAAIAAVALTLTSHPRRGFDLIGRRRLLLWAGLLVVAWGWFLPLIGLGLNVPYGFWHGPVFLLALAVAAVLALRTPAGRRAVALLAAPLTLNITLATFGLLGLSFTSF